MISLARQRHALALLVVTVLSVTLAACSTSNFIDKTLTIATIFPSTGANASVGQAMQRGVDLAVQQNAALPNGYKLTVTHVDEPNASGADIAASLVADKHVMAVVGPYSSDTAVQILPTIEQNSLTTISPSATLPGLTQPAQAAAEGLTFTSLHPKGKPVAFFRLPASDSALGVAAASFATAPTATHGLAAHSVYLVDDGSASGKALAAAFRQQLAAQQGTVAGQQSITIGAQGNGQSIVSAIVGANPDIVFYAGGIAGGAELRQLLSLSGVPLLPILTAGAIANDPDWSATVGVVPASAHTIGLLSAPDLSTVTNAKSFTSAYQAAFPGQALLPQSAQAYDAAMDEITAIKALLTAKQPVTRAAVLAKVAAAKYSGVTGVLAFDANGDSVTPPPFSLYTCDIKGAWRYQTSVHP